MTKEMIVDNEHMMMEEGRLPWVVSFDEHNYHIREHLELETRISFEHIVEHLYYIAMDKTPYNGSFEDFRGIVAGYVEWSFRHHRRMQG